VRYGFDADGRLRTIGTWSYFTYEPGRIVERCWLGRKILGGLLNECSQVA